MTRSIPTRVEFTARLESVELTQAAVAFTADGWSVTATGSRIGVEGVRVGPASCTWTEAAHGDSAPAWVRGLVADARVGERAA